ncbi:hypothetical protein EYC84_004498 [Monilinia fructicola]|uniref:Uncharacterized protein n=1 Tax=Monilinia fructicola TaxID=38448 RepID=A0A5M9K0L0_MONFR|nr:hypothetical protein EYC84_004498 [Monilinia fructicola]
MDYSTAMNRSFTSLILWSIKHCKWIEKCNEVEWRVKMASLNILLTATVWRQVSKHSFLHLTLPILKLHLNDFYFSVHFVASILLPSS